MDKEGLLLVIGLEDGVYLYEVKTHISYKLPPFANDSEYEISYCFSNDSTYLLAACAWTAFCVYDLRDLQAIKATMVPFPFDLEYYWLGSHPINRSYLPNLLEFQLAFMKQIPEEAGAEDMEMIVIKIPLENLAKTSFYRQKATIMREMMTTTVPLTQLYSASKWNYVELYDCHSSKYPRLVESYRHTYDNFVLPYFYNAATRQILEEVGKTKVYYIRDLASRTKTPIDIYPLYFPDICRAAPAYPYFVCVILSTIPTVPQTLVVFDHNMQEVCRFITTITPQPPIMSIFIDCQGVMYVCQEIESSADYTIFTFDFNSYLPKE
jgi:hypothetical protein